MDYKIMIIDAHPVYALKTQAFLEGLTFKDVTIVNKGMKVQEQISNLKPDLIILSGMLPDINSLEVLKTIKNTNAHIPIVIQVGVLADDKICNEFLSNGAAIVLPRLERNFQPLQEFIETSLIKI